MTTEQDIMVTIIAILLMVAVVAIPIMNHRLAESREKWLNRRGK